MSPNISRMSDGSPENITAKIEARAATIRRSLERDDEDAQQGIARALLEHEIALVSEQLQRDRGIHQDLLSDIRMSEQRISKELHDHRYSHWRIIDSLKQKVLALQAERRREILGHEIRLQHAHDRLLALITEHTYIKHNGHSKAPRQT